MITTTATTRTTSTCLSTVTAIAITVISVCSVSPALAAPLRDTASPSAVVATFGVPFDALGGQTLAQYLADHQAADPRLR